MSVPADFLSAAAFFGGVDATAADELTRDLRRLSLGHGDVLVRQGESNHNLFLVLSGRLRVTGRTRDGEVRVLFDVQPGETVCEMALLADEPSALTVDAIVETTVLVLPRDRFEAFAAARPDAALHLNQFVGRRLQAHRLSVALHLGQMFDANDPDLVRDLERELETFTLYGGEILFRKGDPGDSLYLVIGGRLKVVHPDGEHIVAELGPGEIVGEMAAISGEPRSAAVIAVRDTLLGRLTREEFDRLIEKHPKWGMQAIGRRLAQRLRDTMSGRKAGPDSVATVAIVPIHRATRARAFCEQLAAALSAFGPSLHLTSGRVDERLGRAGIAQTFERDGLNVRVAEWLAGQETAHRYVLFEADPVLSPWTERCIRQADQILLVGDADGDPTMCDIETEVLDGTSGRHHGRQWLVLVHRGESPSGTARWLAARHVERHVHVALGNRGSFERLARLLTGRAVGLTLGGGFARGLAHLGVLRAFDEFGVPVDVIGSASMGAMLGALWCMGWERDRIMREVSAACSNYLGDWTFPFVAFKGGGKFSQRVRALFGDVRIEDLWTPFFCTSANLNRTELKIHTEGVLAKSVLASTRAPAVFPPIVYDGELHVDGGVINNVPVDLMKDFCNQGLTIGVDVAPPHQLKPVRDYGDQISGWSTFWRRCVARERLYTPSILLVIIRTLEYTGIANQSMRVQYADIFMSPEMLKFRRTDFHLAADIEQAGYDCARASLAQHWDRIQTIGKPDMVRPPSAS